MLIKSITMNNFRQFKGEQRLEFSTDSEKNVTVLLGDNTFGKTTILQAFNWCLYGVADFPKNSRPDFLLNLDLANGQGSDTCYDVYVKLILEHEGKEYTIKRAQRYTNTGFDSERWSADSAVVKIFYKESDGRTKEVREGEERRVINNILPASLSGYFFFDTERVSDISARKDLKDAVSGLLGLAPVEKARKHIGEETKKKSAIGQWYEARDNNGDGRASEAKSTIDRESARIDELNQQIADIDAELKKLSEQKEKIDKILRDNEATAALQLEKQRLEAELEKTQTTLEQSNKSFKEFYSHEALNYLMQPLLVGAEETLSRSKLADVGIRDMTEASIRSIIERGVCVCGAPVTSESAAYHHLLEEIKNLPPTNISTAVQSFRELIKNNERNRETFMPNIAERYRTLNDIRDNIMATEAKISDISEQISGKENMGEHEANLRRIENNIESNIEQRNRCNRDIGAAENSMASAKKVYDGLAVATEKNARIDRYVAYAQNICDWIDDHYEAKQNEMRTNLESQVNAIFKRMYHGERRVRIDNNFSVSLLAWVQGKEQETGESEGLKRVKNFAFIAGLVNIAKQKASMGNKTDEISWQNEAYPLVMDAPFSNADETHIQNISQILPEVANQVIMFVMEKDWQYAKNVMAGRVGRYCNLKKNSETYTEISLGGDANV